jgi:hypothetical protein
MYTLIKKDVKLNTERTPVVLPYENTFGISKT